MGCSNLYYLMEISKTPKEDSLYDSSLGTVINNLSS